MAMDVKQEIIKALHKLYPDISIRAEETKQGFKGPCFFVRQLKMTQKNGLQDRYRRKTDFDILYFAQNETNAELETMGAELAEELAFLPEAKLKGQGMEYRVVESVLHLLVTYPTSLIQLRTYPKMRTLQGEVITDDKDRENH